MQRGYSPYDMCSEAVRLINCCSTKDDLENYERQIICLLNKADTFPDMSKYQLAIAHKTLADMYFDLDIKGSALEHYEIGIDLYPKLSAKRKIAEIKKMDSSVLSYSLDPNLADEPDYSPLNYHDIGVVALYHNKHSVHDTLGKKAMDELQRKAEEEDNIYDEEFEQMIKERLSKLDELSRSEFYRLRTHRKNNGVLSAKDIDLLTLEAMEKSYNYRKDK